MPEINSPENPEESPCVGVPERKHIETPDETPIPLPIKLPEKEPVGVPVEIPELIPVPAWPV